MLHRLLSPEGAELRPHSSGLPAVDSADAWPALYIEHLLWAPQRRCWH